MKTCVNLRERFGKTYKITHDEAYEAERGEFRTESEPHLQQIPCVKGHIYPSEGEILAVFVHGGQTRTRLRNLPGLTTFSDGYDGETFLFNVEHFAAVAEIMQPRRRRKCHLSPDGLKRLAEQGRRIVAKINLDRSQQKKQG